MAPEPAVLLRHIRGLVAPAGAEETDRDLLRRFAAVRDEAAFAALVRRHGRLVWNVCRQLLGHEQDAEDAFQATFLTLARRAASIRTEEAVGSWLHGVARRVASAVRRSAERRRAREQHVGARAPDGPATEAALRELQAMLSEEVGRLPEKFRSVFVLCCLEGRSKPEAARELGWNEGTVSSRLARARELLRKRLGRRGVDLSAALCATALAADAVSAAVPPALIDAAARVAATPQTPSSAVAVLADVGCRAGGRTSIFVRTIALVTVGVVLAGLGWAGGRDAPKAPPPKDMEVPPNPEDAVPRDIHGDPLPPGAVARLGTLRLRAQVTAFAFSPDGRVLATVGRGPGPRLWSIPSGRELERPPVPQVAWDAVAISHDGKMFAVATGGLIAVHDLSLADTPSVGKERLRIKPENGSPIFLAFLPSAHLLAGAADGRVTVWDAAGKAIRCFGTAAERTAHVFALTADGKKLAIGNSRDENVRLWDVDTGRPEGALPGHQYVSSLAFSADGKALASGDAANTVRLWDVASGKQTARLVRNQGPQQTGGNNDLITSLVFTPDGKTLASVGDHAAGTVRLWDVASGKERGRLECQYGDGRLLALSPDGKTLAVTGSNNTVRRWDITTGRELDAERGTQGAVHTVAVAPDGKEVATGGSDGVVRFWDRATGKELRSFRAHLQQINALAYTPDGRRLATASGSFEAAALWDVPSCKEVRSISGAEKAGSVYNLCFSPDGKKLALTTFDSNMPMNEPLIQLVDAATGKVERTVARGRFDRVVFSPNGRTLAGSGMDAKVHLWDVTTGKELWSATNLNAIASLAFAPDGRTVAAGTYYENEVVLYDAATGRQVRRLRHPSSVVRAVVISPDSRLLAASGDTAEVLVYELATGEVLHRLKGHGAGVWSLAFTPDGRALVSGSFDATALVWDLKRLPKP
jgi:RNA polymerase sigma factor (sigma-70 family)